MNELQGVLQPEGQVNYSVQFPGVIKAWHRHAEQTDFWMVVQGQMKVGIHRSTDQTSWSLVTGERRPGTLVIPPTLWHGATTAGPVQAGLLYYVTKAFCPESPDEERMAHDAIEGFLGTSNIVRSDAIHSRRPFTSNIDCWGQRNAGQKLVTRMRQKQPPLGRTYSSGSRSAKSKTIGNTFICKLQRGHQLCRMD